MAYAAVGFDLLTALLDTWTLWSDVAGDRALGMRWHAASQALLRGKRYRPFEDIVRETAGEVGLDANAPETFSGGGANLNHGRTSRQCSNGWTARDGSWSRTAPESSDASPPSVRGVSSSSSRRRRPAHTSPIPFRIGWRWSVLPSIPPRCSSSPGRLTTSAARRVWGWMSTGRIAVARRHQRTARHCGKSLIFAVSLRHWAWRLDDRPGRDDTT